MLDEPIKRCEGDFCTYKSFLHLFVFISKYLRGEGRTGWAAQCFKTQNSKLIWLLTKKDFESEMFNTFFQMHLACVVVVPFPRVREARKGMDREKS